MRTARKTEMRARYVYVIRRDNRCCKIGISRNPKRRRSSLQDASPEKLELVFFAKPKTLAPIEVEQRALSLLAFLGRRGEWISCRSELAVEVVRRLGENDPSVDGLIERLKSFVANESDRATRDSFRTEFPDLMLAYQGRQFGDRLGV